GDLGQVEHVDDVEPVAGDVELAVAVDREVAERMRGRGEGRGERGKCGGGKHQALHRAYPRATDDQRSEKCGLSASARRNQVRASADWPRQRSIMPRWKNFVASCVPRRSASFE